jgi:outer membrane protein
VFHLSLKALVLSAAMLCMPLAAAFGETLQEAQEQILALIGAGDYDGAIAVAEGFEPSHPNHTARVEFVRGMVAKAKGQHKAAIRLFRKVLASQPQLTPARQHLAHALFLDKDFEAARHHFDILQATTADPRLRQLYASYADAIESERPWSLSGYLTLAPSSNINKGSGKDTATLFGNSGWEIPKSQQRKSGVGLAAGANGTYTFKVGNGVALVAGGGVDGRFHANHDDDALRVNASLKPTFEFGNVKIAIGPYIAGSFAGYERTLTQYGLDSDLSLKLDQSLLFSGSFAALKQDFENNKRDGEKFSFDGSLIKLLGTTTVLGVNAGMIVENAAVIDYDHKDWNLGVNIGHEWNGGLITRGNASYGHHQYEGVLAGKADARKDMVVSAGVQLSHRSFSYLGFMPILNYTFTRQKSNDEYSDFSSHDVAITLTRGF